MGAPWGLRAIRQAHPTGKIEDRALRLLELTQNAAEALKNTGSFLHGLTTPVVRLGVTGLAHAGKTVFITALVRSLLAGGRLPFFAALAENRITRAYLEPQPDDTLPRFAYEEHLAALAANPPRWPESTRRLSQLRLTIEYASAFRLRRALGPGRLHVDILDYPGEWLMDLPLLQQSFADWSNQAVAEARTRSAADEWLAFLAQLTPDAPANEQQALAGAQCFTRYLQTAHHTALCPPGPGRFRLPGDLAGSPLLTFFPLPPGNSGGYARGTLGAMLARRFESYKARVVAPFFRKHFARLDRQIVLIDALSALNAGPPGVRELRATLQAILFCFRPGANTWLSGIIAPRVARLLLAASKADHLHHANHDRLERIVHLLAEKPIARAQVAGAEVKVLALAALRATREAEARQGRDVLPCIVGVPLSGERIGRKVFDGRTEAALFPGDLPVDPARMLDLSASQPGDEVCFLTFRPPRVAGDALGGVAHVRLDRALEFLLGDLLL
jgi:predicted YcjX-like family ATPase